MVAQDVPVRDGLIDGCRRTSVLFVAVIQFDEEGRRKDEFRMSFIMSKHEPAP